MNGVWTTPRLTMAVDRIGRGVSLADSAELAGVTPPELDYALWVKLGRRTCDAVQLLNRRDPALDGRARA